MASWIGELVKVHILTDAHRQKGKLNVKIICSHTAAYLRPVCHCDFTKCNNELKAQTVNLVILFW